MRLVTYAGPDGPRPGALAGEDEVVDLALVAPSVEAMIAVVRGGG